MQLSALQTIEPAALVTEYAMVLPEADTPAMDEVNRKAPPSGLALKVGKALRRRCNCALQLTAQD